MKIITDTSLFWGATHPWLHPPVHGTSIAKSFLTLHRIISKKMYNETCKTSTERPL